MPKDLFESVWRKQSSVLKVLGAALPDDLGTYAGGTGNRQFLNKVDQATGFWTAGTGSVRWIFHVIPNGDNFLVQLPSRPGATDLPGGMNTIGVPPKAVLTYVAVALFQNVDGSFEWPTGWQWIVYFSLKEEVPPNTSAKIHKPHPAGGTLRADKNIIPISDWGVLGIVEPATPYVSNAFSRPLTYAEVGKAIAECIGSLSPT